MIGIMLDIQTDESLRYSEDDSDEYTTFTPARRIRKGHGRRELVLHEGEECYVGKGTDEESGGAIFTPSAHNLKDFVFYLSFEWSVKFVPDQNKQKSDEDFMDNDETMIIMSRYLTYSGS